VTERDWNDVWLSEGFATYFTALFIEHAYGRDEFVDTMRKSRQTVLDFDAKTPNYRVVHENLDDMSKVTSAMTYQKGGWTLHMLRQRMGDDRFWAGIRAYYQTHMNSTALTADFRHAMEVAAGEPLGPFFDQWLYRGGVPRLSGTWSWNAAAKTVTVDLTQTQTGAPFQIPVEIGLQLAGGASRVERIDMTGASAHAVFNVATEPTSLVIDPSVKLLAAAEIVKK
jgi:aminopeptidase N